MTMTAYRPRWPLTEQQAERILADARGLGACGVAVLDSAGRVLAHCGDRAVPAGSGAATPDAAVARAPVLVRGSVAAEVHLVGPLGMEAPLGAKTPLAAIARVTAARLADVWEAAEEIDNLAGEIVRNSEELHLLYELGEALTSQLSVTAAADLILEKILGVLQVARAELRLTDHDGPLSVRYGAPNRRAPGRPDQNWSDFGRPDDGRPGEGRPGDGRSEADEYRLSTTLRSGGETVGTIALARPPAGGPFSSAESKLLDAVGTLAGNAVRNSQLYEDLKRQIEEVQRTQAQLVQSAKLAAIGELAANIAHEINNPLTGILMNVSLALDGDGETGADGAGEPVQGREELRVIQEETLRARDIVRHLLDFARQTAPRPEPVDLNRVVTQTLGLAGRFLESNRIRVACDLAPDLPVVSADANQLKQVFLNLVNNAVHAMPAGGDLRLTVRREAADVVAYVADTGTGIPAEHLPRIFDPFFSTKTEVKGTGLGLSVSHGIIARHRGTIQVASEPGEGTTFRVALPVRDPG